MIEGVYSLYHYLFLSVGEQTMIVWMYLKLSRAQITEKKVWAILILVFPLIYFPIRSTDLHFQFIFSVPYILNMILFIFVGHEYKVPIRKTVESIMIIYIAIIVSQGITIAPFMIILERELMLIEIMMALYLLYFPMLYGLTKLILFCQERKVE